ncbi:MAG: hypothetical protein HQ579_06775 [Candidatus Omnitrophica bacterium]|nr:hypothetical protein [Candidatus Omnitrophota bacterium]
MFTEDIKNIKSTKKELREFGLTMGIVLFIIVAVMTLLLKKPINYYFVIVATFFIALGLVLPKVLKPLQKGWMTFSIVIGFFMSRVILTILFYLVLTPIGLLMKIFGKDILDERIDKTKTSYWQDVEDKVKAKESYENQY